MESHCDSKIHTCLCGTNRFYVQTQLILKASGVYSGDDCIFECVGCGLLYNKNGENV